MISRHLLRSLILTLLLSSATWAQKPATTAQTDEQRKAQQELKLKALSLLDEVIKDSESFKHAENRIRVRAVAANILWEHDEPRARILFKEVTTALADLLHEQETADAQEYSRMMEGPRQLRGELLQMLAQRDARLARDFLRATRPQNPQPVGPHGARPDQPLEMSLATQIAATDPKQAMELAEENLSRGLSYELPNLISTLREKDPEAAAKLASQVMAKLRTEKLSSNDIAKQVAGSLLRQAAMGDEGKGAGSGTPLLDQQALRELIEMVAAEALRPNSTGMELLGLLQEMMPVIEKYAPARAAQVRRRTETTTTKTTSVDDEDDDGGANIAGEVMSGDESADALLAAASQSTGETREVYYQHAAAKLMEEGDTERARQIISEHVKDPGRRREMLEKLDEMATLASARQGNIEQARKILSTLRTNEERIMVLVQLAASAAEKGDKKSALQLLDEAHVITSARARNAKELGLQLAVARAYAPLDASRSLAMLEPVVDQLNDLLSAAVVLGSFFAEEMVRDDEIMMEPLTAISSGFLFNYLGDVNALARGDFERTRALADRFQRYEIRAVARLLVAQSILSPQSKPDDGERITTTTDTITIENNQP